MNEKYEIVQESVLACRVSKIDEDRIKDCVILRIVKYDTGEFLCSKIRTIPKQNLTKINDYVKKGILMQIRMVEVRLKVDMHHYLTWDDVFKGVTNRAYVNKVQCDIFGNPLVYKAGTVIRLFDYFGEHIKIHKELRNGQLCEVVESGTITSPELVGNQMCQDYAEVGSSYAAEKLKYSNRESYLRSKKTDEMSLQEDNDDCRSNFYDSWIENAERRSYEEYDMSEEDMIMSALENGQGEVFGN